jgi:hypothetical protein
VDNLESNWAYMVMTALAWNLKAWWGLMLPEGVPLEKQASVSHDGHGTKARAVPGYLAGSDR